MRPVRLELKGFSTFRDQTVVDFSDLDLVAFVGPTGAGKSTIIDGIIFALYGSVVRYKASNLVAPVINQLSTEARIRLDFAIGPTEYTAVRVVRRTAKGATTKEARLESDGEVLAGNARELDEQIEDLLGLTFDQFTKTVVLPQGEFARFLTETPEARQSLLRRLLGMELYRSMGTTARERARTADTKRTALVEQRDDRDVVTSEVVAEAAGAFASLSALQGVIADEIDAVTFAEAEAAAATDQVGTAEEQLELLLALKVPAAAGRLEKAIAKLEDKRSAAQEAAEASAVQLADAKDAVDELPAITDLERLLELHAEANDIDGRASDAVRDATTTGSAAEKATKAEAKATTALGEAEAKRNDARIRAGAAGLRDALIAGEACPVCDQVVEQLPDHDVVAELETLDAQVDNQRAVADLARTERRDAEAAHARAEAEVASLENRRRDLNEALDGEPDLKATTSQMRAARSAQTSLDKAQAKAERALADLQAVDASSTELDAESSALRRDLTAARDGLAPLDPPAPSEESITADWSALVEWSGTVTAEVRAAKKAATAEAKAASKRVTDHQRVIDDLLAPHTDGHRPDDPVAWLAAEIGRSQAHVESLEREQAAQQKTNDRIDALQTESNVAGELGRLLNARGFEQWLMTDVMHALAERATERLIELSGGAYSLLTDGTDFSIRDHRNADEVRGARTLSGGETFLASLSLALALTDNIASLASEGAPAIESMFLDEGFGTLDAETLDVVASAIEELGAEGRMIGLVTHIRDLADRIPVRFEVARTPNGSTVTRTTLD
jgi:exonuclease SbcC